MYDVGDDRVWLISRSGGLGVLVLAFPLALLPLATAAIAADPIVGNWVGTLRQDEGEPFETRLTFVSPKGGISRYPASTCGGMLVGGPKGDGYEYQEIITWGGADERTENWCIGGTVQITVDGDKMNFLWSTVDNGTETKSVGELRRQRR